MQKDMGPFKVHSDVMAVMDAGKHAPLTALVEQSVHRFLPRFARRLFITPEHRAKSSDGHTQYYSARRLEGLAGFALRSFPTCIIVGLLIGPLILLVEHDTSRTTALAIISGFTLLFSATLSLITSAKPEENFAATAAYCAVLVVFLANLLPGPASS
ncbi:hypothetical protein LTR36_008953 [Oleoguttula mirabilis]|uniref:DUF6594 domain-containing protein n=1 Tax=Oleoguttula mirabilis TaxID=1507867 RepID=A0AAV9J7S9_9PEZI|nr:hypothetical protein LTR36_008953 [Oleoguttula mirabilis]